MKSAERTNESKEKGKGSQETTQTYQSKDPKGLQDVPANVLIGGTGT